MDIGILGPLIVQSSGNQAVPSAPKPRQLLALLATRVGRVVSVDAIVDELWESNPPASALTTVQTYIVLLRRSLAASLRISTDDVAREALPYTGWGYRLVSDRGTHDVMAFTRFADLGRRALAEGHDDQASDLLRRALRTWRGPALADVRVGPQLLADRTSLEENRLSVVEQRIEADLRIGRHHELVAELSGLAVQNPLHENIHSLLMIALYRAGRPGQALETFHKLERNLELELRITPSCRIRALRHGILSGDASLEGTRRSKLFLQELAAPVGTAH